MAVYLVSYDLKKPGQNYFPLYEVLKSGASWWHYLDSTWMIDSHESIEVWEQRIKSQLDQNDSFLIVKLLAGQSYVGWLPREAWEWVKQRLGA
ncbi:MAG TPA: hypothetical protein DF383_05570 [Deltaproteobacteria bacterium]|nr:hypothetical protein [Deltaproteobacteria bacterium]